MTSGAKGPLGFVLLATVALAASALAQHQGHAQHQMTPSTVAPTGAASPPAASRKVTMEELHQSGGVPRGWKFALPGGDPMKGRQVFVADSLSVAQLIDLVAFLQSLTAGGHAHAAAPAEKTTEVYTVRLDYRGGGDHAGHEGHAGHGAAAAPGHLMVFVLDRATGEPVAYLPVSATIRASGKPVRRVTLSPMVGGQGFHYGVNVTLPDGAHTITLTIGPIGVQAMPAVKGRFAKPATIVFERGA